MDTARMVQECDQKAGAVFACRAVNERRARG
jgi:hypothetical protein